MLIRNEVRSDHRSSSSPLAVHFHPRAIVTKSGSTVLDRRSQLLFHQWMPDDPTPFIQKEAVVPKVGAGEERLQIVDLVLLGLGQQVQQVRMQMFKRSLSSVLCGSTHEGLPCSSGPPL